MNVQKVLEIADEIIFERTGKHLDSLQTSILKGVWQHQQYTEIAEEYRCTEGHVKDVSYELWSILSDVLGEKVRKSNVKAAFERNQINQVNFNTKDVVHIGDVHICGSHEQDQSRDTNKDKDKISKLKELGLNAEQIANALNLSVADLID